MTGDGGDLANIGVLGVNEIFARRFETWAMITLYTYH